jgi:2'-5' RNA ligase
MNLENQQHAWEENWKQNAPLFGSKQWVPDPNFLFFIEIPIPAKMRTEMEQVLEKLKFREAFSQGHWIAPQRMHITLALPGRMGVHFQQNEVGFMEKTIEKILENVKSFEVRLGNVNCFPDALFREVLDESGELQRLHNKICKAIPFSQNPEYRFENYKPHISLFYGAHHADLLEGESFDRQLKPTTIKVEKVFFGKAKNEHGEYEKHILREFLLKQ